MTCEKSQFDTIVFVEYELVLLVPPPPHLIPLHVLQPTWIPCSLDGSDDDGSDSDGSGDAGAGAPATPFAAGLTLDIQPVRGGRKSGAPWLAEVRVCPQMGCGRGACCTRRAGLPTNAACNGDKAFRKMGRRLVRC